MITEEKREIALKVLDYWYMMEFLGQDKIPQLTAEEKRKNREAAQGSAKGKNKVLHLMVPVHEKDDPSEIAAKEAQSRGMERWGSLTFYVGKIRREICIREIAAILNAADERPEESEDEIAWFSFQLDAKGNYVEKSFSLSTILWAISHADRLSGDNMAEQLNERDYWEAQEGIEGIFQSIAERGCETEKAEGIGYRDIRRIYDEIYEKYVRKIAGEAKADFFCLMEFQLFADAEAQEQYEDDTYSGLSMDFYSQDLKLVRENLKDKYSAQDEGMLNAIVDYIVGAYAEFYPDQKILSFERFDVGGKTDPLQMREFLAKTLNLGCAPLGKWPSRFMPALMQQVAINLVCADAENTAIFSVNGPPGTGKTTMLKEMIVHNIVERAALLAEYDRPDDAFEACSFLHGEKKNNGYSNFYSQYYKLKDERINDYGILVASNNNAAVQNITKELPVESGIIEALNASDDDSEQMRKQLKEVQELFSVAKSSDTEKLYQKDKSKSGVYQDVYFSAYAGALLGGEAAWGLISVPLGKKSNIHRFYNQVLKPLDEDFYKNSVIEKRPYIAARDQFLQQRKRVEELTEKLALYCDAERAMRESCMRLKVQQEQLAALIGQQMERISSEEKKLEAQQEELTDTWQKYLKAEKLSDAQHREMEKKKQEFQKADCAYKEALEKWLAARKGISLLGKIFQKKDTRIKEELAGRCQAEAEEKKKALATAEEELRKLTEKCEHLERECSGLLQKTEEQKAIYRELQQELTQEEQAVEDNRLRRDQCELETDQEKRRYAALISAGKNAGDTERFIALDDAFMEKLFAEEAEASTEAQVANPWFTAFYNREREKLFYAALKMNKEFVLASKCCLKNFRNLGLLWQERKDDEDNRTVTFHPEDREACFGPLLQTVFLLTPVISTTFASVGSFLKSLKQPGVLGTLIIDEAGQAPPQMALGALYRSRRAIIVGDPRQVEPVVTGDLDLLRKVYREDVYKPYKSKRNSVQQFADIINPYGTYLMGEGNIEEWTGCPLVVHRRCISPMYEISNSISYNNMMKQQTRMPGAKKAEGFCYSGSRWINVKGKEKGHKNHFVEEQGQRVLEILELAFSGNDAPGIFIITPFTSVKNGMLNCINQALQKQNDSVLYEKREAVKAWMYSHVGTVHTFQGKEADEVIFLLGCDSGREAAGAVKWVNSNIINVAVTRAKYRLYIIGDECAWKESEYVMLAKSIIDTYALKELGDTVNHSGGDMERRKERALLFSSQLPSAEAFSMERGENEEGEEDYSFQTEIFLSELKSSHILLKEITDEQLKGYGFTRNSFDDLNPEVKSHVEWGIKLYSMFKSLNTIFEIQELDASCCAILFCKAIELQVKKCFYDGLCSQLPDSIVKGKTKLREAKPDTITLGTFWYILNRPENRRVLSACMKRLGKGEYDDRWWENYADRLGGCRDLRNKCCHHNRFSWKDMNCLLVNLFLRDKNMRHTDGVFRDSEIGKYLGESPSAD